MLVDVSDQELKNIQRAISQSYQCIIFLSCTLTLRTSCTGTSTCILILLMYFADPWWFLISPKDMYHATAHVNFHYFITVSQSLHILSKFSDTHPTTKKRQFNSSSLIITDESRILIWKWNQTGILRQISQFSVFDMLSCTFWKRTGLPQQNMFWGGQFF